MVQKSSRKEKSDEQTASPQLENGFTRVANELLEAISRVRLSPNAYRVLVAIIRLTYGFHEKNWPISARNIAKVTGIARPNVWRALRELEGKNIITRLGTAKELGLRRQKGKRWFDPRTTVWALQKDYLVWEGYVKMGIATSTTQVGIGSDTHVGIEVDTQKGIGVDTQLGVHKDNIRKLKIDSDSSFFSFSLSEKERVLKEFDVAKNWTGKIAHSRSLPWIKLAAVQGIQKGYKPGGVIVNRFKEVWYPDLEEEHESLLGPEEAATIYPKMRAEVRAMSEERKSILALAALACANCFGCRGDNLARRDRLKPKDPLVYWKHQYLDGDEEWACWVMHGYLKARGTLADLLDDSGGDKAWSE